MQLSTQRLVLVLSVALVAGCSSAPEKQEPLTADERHGVEMAGASGTAAMPFQAPIQSAKELTPDMFDPVTLKIYNSVLEDAFNGTIPGEPGWVIVSYIG